MNSSIEDSGYKFYARGVIRDQITTLKKIAAYLGRDHKKLIPMRLLKDDFISLPNNWLVDFNNHVFVPLEKFIQEAQQHGIIKHFENLMEHAQMPPDPEKEPNVLTMFMLSAGFLVWLVTVIFACVIFICEHIIYYISIKRKKNSIIIQVAEFNNYD